jgi:hypothetical protein
MNERNALQGKLESIAKIAGGDWGINAVESMRRINELARQP